MKQASKYEEEINRMTAIERTLIAAVLIVLLLIFFLATQERKELDVPGLQAEQTKGGEQ